MTHTTLNALDDQRGRPHKRLKHSQLTFNTGIKRIRPLIPPQILYEDLPLTDELAKIVDKGRKEAENIVSGKDDRLLVIVGPCSMHDPEAALEYVKLLKGYADNAKEDLCIIARTYFEKPRTTVGWKGLINDPFLNDTNEINKGLRIGRKLLLDVVGLGMPTACEFLDTITPQFTADVSSWGAIGARTTESQVHRELASGLSMPIGFKNGTDGNVQVSIDAIRSSQSPHTFLSVTKQGLAAIVESNGNPYGHVILRGGKTPNYERPHVELAAAQLAKAGLTPKIMIDCSHGNSSKQHARQAIVAQDIVDQISSGDEHAQRIVGVMMESNIKDGRQNVPAEGPTGLEYGKSITDACIDWETTVTVLDNLRKGVQDRRKNKSV
ncbi:3-deoxy-7-phosphoheptulonate synthase [Wallemia mellicola CBS 633.66]|uniref:Phospho-2-dehydro-3-deoxyheptonate aldolase n=2 Tax=Wallemia mellicola TaxID=1708541 RepID=A0A4V4MYM4_9BASI|nr:3-deoxy-7-phosphoheptulonate synthase [Wallemia mellicola CBS 633.66]TIB73514.1 hypothetical protein E3Q23_02969 [Wallemia mellicola]EIM23143.1 3-deoxy-7-phosphoheptulonate synthase [Wallemia mellicola CBS 633.66]TIB82941.1 3-deoxy-7-phosphoheptulonate synthase [Wallemia mellicola]TIB85581.1 3-deoxy-7-phosphoheptulonate synthase [Wallemia mellicola]TIB98295.1 3-deoxy-7-phosphoheptulonate synthase [Wallemia mellicola]|eukprot:XP_006956510.1 3-deoxy-7-phosphoheptulonate synthase [Wallemia mellicola CBS 633.66]